MPLAPVTSGHHRGSRRPPVPGRTSGS
jgi:hypothetical protein